MTETATALYNFMSSFSIPAYVEGYVPDTQALPYITYTLAKPDWQSQVSINMRVWYRTTSYTTITSKVQEIANRIGDGISIPTANGCIVIYKDNNFVQFITDEDDSIKEAYISLILQAYN